MFHGWSKIQWQSQASLNRICAALCLTLISISVNINLIHETIDRWLFSNTSLPNTWSTPPSNCVWSCWLSTYPIYLYSEIHIHNIWKREQISGSVNMLAIRALWENLENGITSVYRFNQYDKSLIGESSSLTELQ